MTKKITIPISAEIVVEIPDDTISTKLQPISVREGKFAVSDRDCIGTARTGDVYPCYILFEDEGGHALILLSTNDWENECASLIFGEQADGGYWESHLSIEESYSNISEKECEEKILEAFSTVEDKIK